MTLPGRFWAQVEKTETCWLWTGGTYSEGYGRMMIDGVRQGAHRLAYEDLVGPIPAGLELDHGCRVHNCVNPAHLEPVTHAENVRRGRMAEVNAARQRAKTECPYGHPYDEENTYHYRGSRQCRACRRRRSNA